MLLGERDGGNALREIEDALWRSAFLVQYRGDHR